MKVIIASEKIFNEYGDLIKIRYHYEDGTSSEKSIFIASKRIETGIKQVFKVSPDKYYS